MLHLTLMTALAAATSGPAQDLFPPPLLFPTETRVIVFAPPRERPAPPQDVVLHWNEVTLQVIKDERTPPPMAARNLAMVHAAMYDAINGIYQTHTPFRVRAHNVEDTSPEAAASVAAHRILTSLYPCQQERFDNALDDALDALPAGTTRQRGVVLGQRVADRYLAWRRDDGSNRRAADAPGREPGVWQRTPPDYRPGMLPQWGSVTPFAISRPADFKVPPPPSLTNPLYTAAFFEVKALGARNSRARTAEQTLIAQFWADDSGTVTPPGHWNRIAQVVARDRALTVAENARLFALLNLALADAGIVCWHYKFGYNYWRPITAIREADRDGNPDTERDPAWESLLKTPPFPSYVSGHSTFSGAAAAALAGFFGTDNLRFTTTSDGTPGVRRTFERFSDAAAEAGRSRIYGGIHWEFDNSEGLRAGKAIADAIGRTLLRPLSERPVQTTALKRGLSRP